MASKAKVVFPADQNLRDQVKTVNILAQSIQSISNSMDEIKNGPLSEEALLILIQANCTKDSGGRKVKVSIPMSEIKSVLDSIESLAEQYLK